MTGQWCKRSIESCAWLGGLANIVLGLLVLQKRDAAGDQPSSELTDLLRSLLETEVWETGPLSSPLNAECQREALFVTDDDDTVRIPANCRRIEAEVLGVVLDGPLLIAYRERQVVQLHPTRRLPEPTRFYGQDYSASQGTEA
jgi:hypothetical protein